MARIEFKSVSKSFSRQSRTFFWQFLRDILYGRPANSIDVLGNVSFSIGRGESVGVIGPNGAGKSTLLSLVAGLTVPDSGSVHVEGRVSALMELGAGFHPDLTGRENLRINAALLGFTPSEIDEATPRIIDFSGLGDFIDEPLRTYSTGMNMRLGFSVAVHGRPDILLIDEVLAVGDQEFQGKCFDRLDTIRETGTILLCVSHMPQLLARLCGRVIWIESGRLLGDGPAAEVLTAYRDRPMAEVGQAQ